MEGVLERLTGADGLALFLNFLVQTGNREAEKTMSQKLVRRPSGGVLQPNIRTLL